MKCHKPILEKKITVEKEKKKSKYPLIPRGNETRQCVGTDLRTNLDVILLIIPVDVPLLACVKAPGSWDGEAGGPL